MYEWRVIAHGVVIAHGIADTYLEAERKIGVLRLGMHSEINKIK